VNANRMRRALVAALLAAPLAVTAAGAFAQSRAYNEVKPPFPVESGGKIEVNEFFWYGCIHCYNLEPHIENWLKRLPADVEFRRVPAVFSNRLAHDAAIFYTFEAMGLLGKLHHPFFDAIHKDGLKTDNQAALTDWLQKNGVDTKKFFDTLKSFGVQSKVRRAAQVTVASKIDGTPAMAVAGRYTVSAEQGGSREGMLKSVDQLVEMVRKQK
jgi:protein dithiol oxidoreductase (disulfide-forming)